MECSPYPSDVAGAVLLSNRVCLAGYGRVGSQTANYLREKKFDVVIYDSSSEKVEIARRSGFESYLASLDSPSVARRLSRECDAMVTALPSDAAERVLNAMLEASVPIIVDVSYIKDPLMFAEKASRRGVKLFVDAGIAPGLSNMLVASIVNSVEHVEKIHVYVGGLSEDINAPLGLVASWNIGDLIEEYMRKARVRINGRETVLDPIKDSRLVTLEGVGDFEALPTDGLRTLLSSFRNLKTLIEYTLRYPGHVNYLKIFDMIGLLSEHRYVIDGCAVTPSKVLVRLLEEILPKENDRVILVVKGWGKERGEEVEVGYYLDISQKKLGLKTTVLSYLTGLVHGWVTTQALLGGGRVGINPPESLVAKLDNLLAELSSRNIIIKKKRNK